MIAGHARLAIASSAHGADFSHAATRDALVVLNEWEAVKAAAIKTANPRCQVLLYQNLSAMAPRDAGGNVATGVTTQEADASWFLLNTAGEHFAFWGYGWLWAADIGNPAYQRRWLANVQDKLAAGPWDGVFVDDANPTMRDHYDVASVAKYPNDAVYAAAMGAMLKAVGPRLMAAGALVLPNFGEWRLYRDVVRPWLAFVSGGMEENLGKWSPETGQGYLPSPDWDLQLAVIEDTVAAGRLYLGVTKGSPTEHTAMRYGWATVLLASQGRALHAFHHDYGDDLWFTELDYAIGEPTGPRSIDGTGVHRRVFTGGLVLVNPLPVPVQTLLGAAYSGSGLSHATQTTMAAHSGLILKRDA